MRPVRFARSVSALNIRPRLPSAPGLGGPTLKPGPVARPGPVEKPVSAPKLEDVRGDHTHVSRFRLQLFDFRSLPKAFVPKVGAPGVDASKPFQIGVSPIALRAMANNPAMSWGFAASAMGLPGSMRSPGGPRSPFTRSIGVRHMSTLALEPPPKPIDLDKTLVARDQLLASQWEAKATSSAAVKKAFVERDIPAFLEKLREHGGKADMTVAFEMLVAASYTNQKKGASFSAWIDGDATGTFARGSYKFTLEKVYTERLDYRGLRDLEKDRQPGTGFQQWKVEGPGDKTYTFRVHRGTNSVGASRDKTLGNLDGTGANANQDPNGVGYGIAKSLHARQKLDPADVIIGHSLGARIAEDDAMETFRRTGTVPLTYAVASPNGSELPGKDWDTVGARLFRVGSAQDPVRQSGVMVPPSRSFVYGIGALGYQRGLGNSGMDGVFMQHGALPATERAIRGEPVAFKPQDGSAKLAEEDNLDMEQLPFDRLLTELFDRTFRPSVASRAFTGTRREQVMADVARFGFEKELTGAKEKGPRGKDYAFTVALVDTLRQNPAIDNAYGAGPKQTMATIMSLRSAFLADPKLATEKLREKLGLPKDADLTKSEADLAGLVAVAKRDFASE